MADPGSYGEVDSVIGEPQHASFGFTRRKEKQDK